LTYLTRTNIVSAVADFRQIWQNFINLRSDFVVDNGTVKKLKAFYAEQDNWMRSMIKNHPSEEDAYWRHVSYILAQFDGLYAGYRAAALPEWVSQFCCYCVFSHMLKTDVY